MTIDGVVAHRVLRPSSPEDLAGMMAAGEWSVAPVGEGTRLEFGNPLGPVDAAVDMTSLDRVIEYVPSDLTIHVQSGVRLGDLLALLAEHNQMLPLDPWCGPRATLGGIVATNAQGAFRAVGTIRDWIIGMHVVDAAGRASKTGGRVVKNVSGYDLARLYTGSLGSLGLITEVSLKLRSSYPATASARMRCRDVASALRTIGGLRAGPWEPVSFVWTGPENVIWLRFGEHPQAVDWQLGQLDAAWETARDTAQDDLWRELSEVYLALPEPVVRIAVLPDRLGDLVSRVAPSAWLAHPSSGVALMTVPSGQIADLRREFPVILERASREVRRVVPTFGVRGVELEIMRGLKRSMDPAGRLNPGRHVDGEEGP